jgi:hypothetical protein
MKIAAMQKHDIFFRKADSRFVLSFAFSFNYFILPAT